MSIQRRIGLGMLALVVGGWFMHDLVLHLGMLTAPWLMEYEFGLPTNLSSIGISPEVTSQVEGLFFAFAATVLLILLGFRSPRTKV